MVVFDMIRGTEKGFHCEAARVHIDPWVAVERAVVTHAHGDHIVEGCGAYLATPGTAALLAHRLPGARIETLPYGESLSLDGVRLSFHPAGHILGSAQARFEAGGEVWVVSGDYKLAPDPTCAPFEPVRCDVFITEATFGLPIFRWPDARQVVDEIRAWWQENADRGRASVLGVYSLGKAQRVLALLGDGGGPGPIHVHGAIDRLNAIYREQGVALPEASHVGDLRGDALARALILAPSIARGSPWMRRFPDPRTGEASGWMRLRGTRRRRSLDRGFVLSDHADWPALLAAIRATGAARVLVTHGFGRPLARFLAESGIDARPVETAAWGETPEESAA